MYFDVHYDYTTSLHHPWYVSGFVLFQKLKNEKKQQKKEREITLFKSVTPFQLCAHSVCTADAAVITWQVADQGSEGPTGSQVISRHIYSIYSSEVLLLNIAIDLWLFHLQHVQKEYIPLRFHNTPVCLYISNVASFTLPCYVTMPCTGRQSKYWSYQKETYLSIRA